MSGWSLLAPPAELALAAAAAALVLAAAIAFERRRATGGARRRLRLVALTVALVALLVLVARPARLDSARPATVVLLTPGATVADLAAAAAAGLPARTVPGRPGEPAPPLAAEPLPDAAALGRGLPGLARVHVAGHGLTAAEWASLPAVVETAPPPALPFGVASLRWDRRLPLGGELVVSGRVVGIPRGGATATLSGPGLAPVSSRLGAGEAALRLAGLPRGPGRQLLELRLAAPGRPPIVERLEVEVTAQRPPAVLWLEDAPSPESRELARWLQRAGAPLALRSRLSRGIERELVAGAPGGAVPPLAAAELTRFDLAVLDARTLRGLSARERDALAAAVDDGLGLLVRLGDEGGAPAVLGHRFPTRALPGATELAAHLLWEDGALAPPLALAARELRADPGLVPLAADRAGRVLAAWRPAGAGAVAVTLVEGTWRWSREGSEAAFRRYWREVIGTLARPAPAEPRWLAGDGPALVARPLALVLETGEARPRATATDATGGTVPLALRQDPAEPRRWSATLWPRHAGWHRLEGGGAALWIHAAEPERWLALRLAERQQATRARALSRGPRPGAASAASARELVPLPRWPAFLLLVAALAVLWGEEAVSARSRPR